MLFQTSGVVVGIGESTMPASAAKRAERTPGAPAEGVHFETGVVGDDDLARNELGVINGLERGVFGKGLAVFFRRFDLGEIGEADRWRRRAFQRRCGSRGVCPGWSWLRRGEWASIKV